VRPLKIGEARRYENEFTDDDDLSLDECETILDDRIAKPDLDVDDMTVDEIQAYTGAVLDAVLGGFDEDQLDAVEEAIDQRTEGETGN